MKKHVLLSLTLLWALFLLTSCSGGKSTLVGWCLQAENGANLIITEDHGPISMSDQSRGKTLFEGLDNGDRIEVTHDAIAETYPGQAGVYTCKKLSNGHFEDIPQDDVMDLEFMGYAFDSHSHVPAEEPLMVEYPVSAYCGNTITEVLFNGETYSFWGGDSVTLTDILINLSYDANQVCCCTAEFTVNTEFGNGYSVNLSEAYARCKDGQAALTGEQVEQIRGILERNCT